MEDIRQQYVAFNWRNLRPLWSDENLSKKDNYGKEDEALWILKMRSFGFQGDLYTIHQRSSSALLTESL